mmetsp:Transcript_12081/g.22760  ORF Transcript_12081/g.22760 Transcript_12081/m.22760 type:complete len:214 (-) Transcript_12081:92-733(-)
MSQWECKFQLIRQGQGEGQLRWRIWRLWWHGGRLWWLCWERLRQVLWESWGERLWEKLCSQRSCDVRWWQRPKFQHRKQRFLNVSTRGESGIHWWRGCGHVISRRLRGAEQAGGPRGSIPSASVRLSRASCYWGRRQEWHWTSGNRSCDWYGSGRARPGGQPVRESYHHLWWCHRMRFSLLACNLAHGDSSRDDGYGGWHSEFGRWVRRRRAL